MHHTEPVIHSSGSDARIAGRDYHEHHHAAPDVPDPWFRELQHRFARHARDAGCMRCSHCGLRGQPPQTDACIYCGHDVGATRRERQARLARSRRVRRAIGDLRRLCCYFAALVLLSVLYQWGAGLPPHGAGEVFAYAVAALLCVVFVGELMVYGWICVEVWINARLPPLLRRCGLGWLTGGEYV